MIVYINKRNYGSAMCAICQWSFRSNAAARWQPPKFRYQEQLVVPHCGGRAVRASRLIGCPRAQQPCQRQRRISAPGKHQVQRVRLVLHQGGEQRGGRRVRQQMGVVEHQHERLIEAREIADQALERRTRVEAPAGVEQREAGCANIRRYGLNRGDQVAQQPRRVVVAAVEGEPGACRILDCRESKMVQPGGQQRRLAKTGWCGDKGERAGQRRIQPGE